MNVIISNTIPMIIVFLAPIFSVEAFATKLSGTFIALNKNKNNITCPKENPDISKRIGINIPIRLLPTVCSQTLASSFESSV